MTKITILNTHIEGNDGSVPDEMLAEDIQELLRTFDGDESMTPDEEAPVRRKPKWSPLKRRLTDYFLMRDLNF